MADTVYADTSSSWDRFDSWRASTGASPFEPGPFEPGPFEPGPFEPPRFEPGAFGSGWNASASSEIRRAEAVTPEGNGNGGGGRRRHASDADPAAPGYVGRRRRATEENTPSGHSIDEMLASFDGDAAPRRRHRRDDQ
jgi:hypothetical protein